MNKEEAKSILATELSKYRSKPYSELQNLISDLDAYEVVGPSGVKYQLEVQAIWDDATSGNLRVMAGIDDGGISTFAPLTEDFVITPAGTLLG